MTDHHSGMPWLSGDDVHLWVVAEGLMHRDDLQAQAEQLLSAPEQARCRRYRVQRGRRQFIAGRAAVRQLLSLYCPDVGPGDWQIRSSAGGRPELVTGTGPSDSPRFNVSHSGDCVVLAFSKGGTPGVDVEHTDRKRINAGVAERYYSDIEAVGLSGLPADQHKERFLALWTLKEASSKAEGGALGPALGSYVFDLSGQGVITFADVSADGADKNWSFWQYLLADGCLAAVAVRYPVPAVNPQCHVYQLEWPDIVVGARARLLRTSHSETS